MVPCLRLYAYLALQLGKAFPEAEHEYTGQWQAGAAFSRMSLKAPGRAGRPGQERVHSGGQRTFATALSSMLHRQPQPRPAAWPPLCGAEWVRSYSSPEYLRLPGKAEAVLDETAASESFGERGWSVCRCCWQQSGDEKA